MVTERKLFRTLVVVATLALYATMIQSAAARGGGHGGGGHHGGGHHAGHHGGHHGGHNHHPYHPSHHHSSHHASHDHHGDRHHDGHHDHHYAHHHHGWHHGDWGPGFWGGAAVGYGLGYGYGNWGGYGDGGGDTYVDNSTNVTPVSNDGNDAADTDVSDSQDAAAGDDSQSGFPTDDWPELGVVTYAGQYGGSQGQVVVRVVPGSAAAEAGVVPGDVILTFNGKPVPSANDLEAAMDGAGGKFEVVVWDARTGRKSTLDGTLDAAAVAPPANETAATPPAQQ